MSENTQPLCVCVCGGGYPRVSCQQKETPAENTQAHNRLPLIFIIPGHVSYKRHCRCVPKQELSAGPADFVPKSFRQKSPSLRAKYFRVETFSTVFYRAFFISPHVLTFLLQDINCIFWISVTVFSLRLENHLSHSRFT